MIDGLDNLLAETKQLGLAELRVAAADYLRAAEVSGRILAEEGLDTSRSVNRVRLEVDGQVISIIAKRSRPAPAQRNTFVTERWMPAGGLGHAVPRILFTAAQREGRAIWHVYEDLGEEILTRESSDAAIETGLRLVATVHARFVGHMMLAEAREWGGDLGCAFYSTSTRDAITCLEAMPAAELERTGHLPGLRDKLLERLWSMLAEEQERTDAVRALGGPETLLHGDLWLKNVSIVGTDGGLEAKLIDWDHAAVGPAAYDLSTFLNGLAPERRDWALDIYVDAVEGSRLHVPAAEDLNYLFDTFERARIANCILWSAFAVSEGPHVDWAIEELEMAEDWMAELEPILEARCGT